MERPLVETFEGCDRVRRVMEGDIRETLGGLGDSVKGYMDLREGAN